MGAFQRLGFQALGFQDVLEEEEEPPPSASPAGGIPRGFQLFPSVESEQAKDEDEWLMRYLKKLISSGQLER